MIEVKKIFHRGEERIGLFFSYDKTLIDKIKTIKGRKYSKTLQCWYLPCDAESSVALKSLGIPLIYSDQSIENTPDLSPPNSDLWTKIKSELISELNEPKGASLIEFMDYMLDQHYPLKMIKEYTIEVSKNTESKTTTAENKPKNIQKERALRCFKQYLYYKSQKKG